MPPGFVERVVQAASPGARYLKLQPLTAGLRNSNFKLQLNTAPGLVVLRIYEHDPSLCQKEIDLIHLVARTIPVPEMLYAEPDDSETMPPFALFRFIEGLSFREIKRGEIVR